MQPEFSHLPRDSQGTYSLPSGTLVNTGDTILVNQHNPAMQDIATSLSNSLDRDGKGGMRADLPMGGNRITNLADGVDAQDAATVAQLSAAIAVPIGGVIDFAGSTPPTGFLLCYGQAISRTTYASLFAIVGTSFGTGDGSTTFNLPDLRGRVSAGKDDMGGSAASRLTNAASGVAGTTLGASGGAQTHTLTTAQLASHSHSVTDPGHQHTGAGAGVANVAGGGTPIASGVSGVTGTSTTGISIASAGSGEAHNNVQPTLVLNKIIRVS
jgi:microcystin-dependent protein